MTDHDVFRHALQRIVDGMAPHPRCRWCALDNRHSAYCPVAIAAAALAAGGVPAPTTDQDCDCGHPWDKHTRVSGCHRLDCSCLNAPREVPS